MKKRFGEENKNIFQIIWMRLRQFKYRREDEKDRLILPWIFYKASHDQYLYAMTLTNHQVLFFTHINSIKKIGDEYWLDIVLEENLEIDNRNFRQGISVSLKSIVYIADAES